MPHDRQRNEYLSQANVALLDDADRNHAEVHTQGAALRGASRAASGASASVEELVAIFMRRAPYIY
jgi:hypothetical protein